MADRRLIEKIKYKRKEKTLVLQYKQLNDAGKWDKLTLETHDPPDPDFIAAMDSLAPHVIDICEVGETWSPGQLTVSGISVSDSGGIMGAVITAQVKLETSQSPLNINTPSKPEEPYSEGGSDEYCLDPDAVESIKYLLTEAKGYLDGKRAQQSIDFEKDMKEPFEAQMAEQGIDVTLSMKDDGEGVTYGDQDPLYEDAKALVSQHDQTCVSQIQRVLRVGYARAGRIMDELEADGIVSKADAAGNRDVINSTAPDGSGYSLENAEVKDE